MTSPTTGSVSQSVSATSSLTRRSLIGAGASGAALAGLAMFTPAAAVAAKAVPGLATRAGVSRQSCAAAHAATARRLQALCAEMAVPQAVKTRALVTTACPDCHTRIGPVAA